MSLVKRDIARSILQERGRDPKHPERTWLQVICYNSKLFVLLVIELLECAERTLIELDPSLEEMIRARYQRSIALGSPSLFEHREEKEVKTSPVDRQLLAAGDSYRFQMMLYLRHRNPTCFLSPERFPPILWSYLMRFFFSNPYKRDLACLLMVPS